MLAPLKHLLPVLYFSATAISVGLPAPVRALPESVVEQKLDSILLLMAVDRTEQPLLLNVQLDGKPTKAYLGAFSLDSANAVKANRPFGISQAQATEMMFTPVSLARFNAVVGPRLTSGAEALLLPDPAQLEPAARLLQQQGVNANDARTVAANQPMIFCPEPGLLVSTNQGPNAGQQFVPCATEYSFVAQIVERGSKESAEVRKLDPKVVAIPLPNFIQFLRESSNEEADQIRVVPDGRIISVIQQVQQQAGDPAQIKPAANSTKPSQR
jgi:hypothetical protein